MVMMTDDEVNKYSGKKHFIATLRWFADNKGKGLRDEYGHADYWPSRGETTLARGIAEWMENPAVPDKESGLNWYRDLPEMLHECFIDFRTKPEWEELRKAFSVDVEDRYDIPDLVHIHEKGTYGMLTAHSIARLMPAIYCKAHESVGMSQDNGDGSWLHHELESYFDAEWKVIEHAWKRFIRTAYRPYIRRVKDESHRGNSGQFGQTRLLTYCMAGRCMFTFRRGGDDGPQISYVADDSDMYGHRAGPNSTATPYAVCVSMINEVVDNWDIDKMIPDTKVGLGF